MEHIVLAVTGMTCGGCVSSVKRVLHALPGVTEVQVSLEAAQAAVDYDPTKSSRQAMVTAIQNAGFEVPN